jgi:hypothetical protein
MSEPVAPDPQDGDLDEPLARSYGSEAGISIGDIVEVKKAGEWQKDPATVIGKSADGTFDVRMGYPGGLLWHEEGADPYASGTVLKEKTFPDEVRSGEKFKQLIEGKSGLRAKLFACMDNVWVRRICFWMDCCR